MSIEVYEALSEIDGFNELMSHTMTIEQLGGLTNRNFKINCERGSFVLRIAGEGTSDYIDRQAELFNASIASKAGVNAEIVHFDVESGTMISRYIDKARTMDIETLRNVDVLCRAGKVFRQLHDCGEEFQGRFELFEQIDQYLATLNDLNAELPAGFSETQQDAEAVREALSQHELPSKPCHCDPMVENCIDNGQQMYIIDFEYAGNNDPMWDLADISVEGDFTAEQDRVFLEAYFGHAPDAFDVGRMVMYKAMCDLLWTLWGVVQHVNHNPADDFWSYAVGRLQRCKNLMASEAFANHLEAVKHGPA